MKNQVVSVILRSGLQTTMRLEHVSNVQGFDEDFIEITVDHPNGMKDIHKLAKSNILRFSYYNITGVEAPTT